jgi:valacyclovir hydrolase
MQSIVVQDGVRIAYATFGSSGEPVVLLHGFTGTGTGHFPNEIPVLATNHVVYAPDLPGYGQSAPPNRVFGVDFYQRDTQHMIAFIRALGVGPVHLVGFSDGAEIALMIAALAPELVKSALVWGVCGRMTPEMVNSVHKWLPVSAWGDNWAEWKAEIIAFHGEAQFAPMIEGWVAAADAILARGGDILFGVSERIECPVIIVHGRNDHGNPLPVVEALAKTIRNCEFHLLEDVGHDVQFEAPAQLHAIMSRVL